MSNSSNKPTATDVSQWISSATGQGVLSPASASLVTGNLGAVVIAGAAGRALEDIDAADVTLVTVLIDASSSIPGRKLEQPVRDGHGQLLAAFAKSKEKDAVLMATWLFNHQVNVLHSYVPVGDASALDTKNYAGSGGTALYDTWCDALAANVAYAQQLKDGGTPTRSIVVVITDGEDTGSRRTTRDCATITRDVLASEQFIVAFVGVGKDVDFKKVARAMGIPDGCVLVEADATEKGLKRVFQLVSQSAIRASQGRIQPGPAAGFFTP